MRAEQRRKRCRLARPAAVARPPLAKLSPPLLSPLQAAAAAMAKRVLCLFDVDGTLTEPRKVLYFAGLLTYGRRRRALDSQA